MNWDSPRRAGRSREAVTSGRRPAGERASGSSGASAAAPLPTSAFIGVHLWLSGLARRLSHLALLALLVPGLAWAGGLDQDDARRLFRSGAILPLERVLEVVRGYQPGRVIEVELDEDSRRYVYELEILAPDGRVWELEVDAATGRLLERKRED